MMNIQRLTRSHGPSLYITSVLIEYASHNLNSLIYVHTCDLASRESDLYKFDPLFSEHLREND